MTVTPVEGQGREGALETAESSETGAVGQNPETAPCPGPPVEIKPLLPRPAAPSRARPACPVGGGRPITMPFRRASLRSVAVPLPRYHRWTPACLTVNLWPWGLSLVPSRGQGHWGPRGDPPCCGSGALGCVPLKASLSPRCRARSRWAGRPESVPVTLTKQQPRQATRRPARSSGPTPPAFLVLSDSLKAA